MSDGELECLTRAYKEHSKEMELNNKQQERNAFGGGCIVGHILCFIEICLLVLAAWIGKVYWH